MDISALSGTTFNSAQTESISPIGLVSGIDAESTSGRELRRQRIAIAAQARQTAAENQNPQDAAKAEASTEPVTQEASRAAVGRIRFEMEEGTKVAKFFDTKDVLIYQVPPEGRLYLVTAQEEAADGQVETSA